MKKDLDYATKEKELQELLEWFEGDIENIDEAVEKYNKAKKLISQLRAHLDTIKNKVEIISGKD